MIDEQPSYYAVIPANVRYDKKLSPNEKLLYGEITTLCNKTGKCFASNRYFAELYEVEKETVSRWISHLEKQGYINSCIEYKENTKEIVNRYIQLNQYPIDKKINTPIDKKIKDNNTSNNITRFNKERTKFVPPTLEEIKQYAKQKNRLDIAERFYDYFTADEDNKKHWIDSKGNKVKNWKQKFLTWCSYGGVQKETKKDGNFIGREYKTEDMNKLFQNIDDINV